MKVLIVASPIAMFDKEKQTKFRDDIEKHVTNKDYDYIFQLLYGELNNQIFAMRWVKIGDTRNNSWIQDFYSDPNLFLDIVNKNISFESTLIDRLMFIKAENVDFYNSCTIDGFNAYIETRLNKENITINSIIPF